MTQQTDITTTKMTREVAQRILDAGKLKRGGVEVFVFDDKLSNLPPVKNEELAGQDFIIDRICGEIDTRYGKAMIVEVGLRPKLPTFSWLIGMGDSQKQGSVIGDNLRRFIERSKANGSMPFPLWVHLERVVPEDGNPYYALRRPRALQEAIEHDNVPEVPEPAPVVTDVGAVIHRISQEELDELPF